LAQGFDKSLEFGLVVSFLDILDFKPAAVVIEVLTQLRQLLFKLGEQVSALF
jgi:hypothetical protein